MSVEENLIVISFQSALMYVQHRETKNWCLHFCVVSTLNEVFFGVDGQVMSGLLANMAVTVRLLPA